LIQRGALPAVRIGERSVRVNRRELERSLLRTGGLLSNSSTVIYTQRPDATPEAELDVLANAYRFILEGR
jgi:hypothetical protein